MGKIEYKGRNELYGWKGRYFQEQHSWNGRVPKSLLRCDLDLVYGMNHTYDLQDIKASFYYIIIIIDLETV